MTAFHFSLIGIVSLFIHVTLSSQTVPMDSTVNAKFTFVERMPSFPGGDKAMVNFIQQNLIYPPNARENKMEGDVIVQVLINKDGSISSPVVHKSLSPECDIEALRIISIMPLWIPGSHNGKQLNIRFTIPVKFKL